MPEPLALPTRRLARADLALSELGFGAASLGNLYRPRTDADARITLEAALAAGIAYVDTAPHYGFGLSERRVGDILRERDDVVISTKVGRLLVPLPDHRGHAERLGFHTPMPFEPRFDYSYDAIMRSWEHSLQRLGLAKVDILYVHDIGRLTHAERHEAFLTQLTAGGGLRALEELRDAGEIRAFGLGVNEWEICLEVMDYAPIDVILLAGRYTLLEQEALDPFLSVCVQRGTSIVIGGPYNSGILAAGTRGARTPHFNYAPAPAPIIDRVRKIEAVCDDFGVTLAAAALQFPLAHPAVVSVIPGLGNPGQVSQAIALYREAIPDAFWAALREAGLLRADAPVPGAK